MSGREGPGFCGEEQGEAGSLGADREKVWVGLQVYPAQRALLPERWLPGSGKGQRVTTSSWEGAPALQGVWSPALLFLHLGLTPWTPPGWLALLPSSPVLASLARGLAVGGELWLVVVGQGGAWLPLCLGHVSKWGPVVCSFIWKTGSL